MKWGQSFYLQMLCVGFVFLMLGCEPSKNFHLSNNRRNTNQSTEDAKNKEKVIYGQDDRKDLYQIEDVLLKELALSTVVLVESSQLQSQIDGTYKISGKNYSTEYNLCTDEPFYEQKFSGFCSGSLVGKNLILTAGHCITNASQCASTRFVFGYALKQQGQQPEVVSDVYACSRIISRVQNDFTGLDYALIELTENVKDHKPLKVRRNGMADLETPLTVIGHPSGLPLKVASGGRVRSIESMYFVTSLDTYGGNSGSAVFNSLSGEIEGVLVRGEEDYVERGSCNVSNRCSPTGCRGEDVTRIDLIRNLIPEIEENILPEPEVELREYVSEHRVAIPDRDSNGILEVIPVAESTLNKKVYIQVDIEHSYVGDLKLVLVDPNGTEYVLRDKKGGRQINLAGTFGKNIESQTDLKLLSQIDVLGNWTLKVSDLVLKDTGSLKSWKIIIAD